MAENELEGEHNPQAHGTTDPEYLFSVACIDALSSSIMWESISLDRGSRPKGWTEPMPRLSSEAFDRVVREAIDRIPEEFRRHIEDVPILVEQEPTRAVLADLDVPEDETLFGAYFGTPKGERSVFDVPVEPDRIVVYKRPLEDFCDTVEELIEEIEITVVHEVAHHFGIDDEVLARYGYG